jgi:hypothetical protein
MPAVSVKISTGITQGGVEAKYFAKDLKAAHWYGKTLYPNGYSIVQGSVNTTIDLSKYWYPYVDIGAYVFPKNVLPNITPIIP